MDLPGRDSARSSICFAPVYIVEDGRFGSISVVAASTLTTGFLENGRVHGHVMTIGHHRNSIRHWTRADISAQSSGISRPFPGSLEVPVNTLFTLVFPRGTAAVEEGLLHMRPTRRSWRMCRLRRINATTDRCGVSASYICRASPCALGIRALRKEVSLEPLALHLAFRVWNLRLPQFDGIPLGVMQAGEPAVGIRLRINLDRDSSGL